MGRQGAQAATVSRLLAGRYRLTDRLGRGGMGTVWRARDELLRRDVAVKELSLPRGVAEEHRAALCERAMREARVSSRLKHRSIIRVHDVIAEDDRPWIVMELLTGRPLDETAPLPLQRVAAIGLAVLDALRAAHEHGVLHRDVKPGNVFLCDDGRVVLADFGIATLEGDASLTASGGLIGSPGYIAPERLRGEHAGPPSDLWSLGATLYAAVDGRPPFDRRTPMGALGAVLTEEPPPPRWAGLLAPVLMEMLAKDPALRPPADAVAVRLRRLAPGTIAAQAQGCSWGDGLNGDSIDLRIEHFTPRGPTSAPDRAHAYYFDKKRQLGVSAHADDNIHSSQSAVTDVPATGDEAFVYDATDGIDDGRSSIVWLRASNVVIKVGYAHHAGAADAVRLRQGALQAARAVGTRLARG
jgi:serine/threonine protein kinase